MQHQTEQRQNCRRQLQISRINPTGRLKTFSDGLLVLHPQKQQRCTPAATLSDGLHTILTKFNFSFSLPRVYVKTAAEKNNRVMTDPTPAKEKNMELNQLKAFVTVAHQGNLTQASERLFLSQPAVSAQIKAIENELGTPLFVRNSNGMSLTRAGEIFLPEAESLLQHKHRLEHFAKTLAANHTEEIRLGLIHPVDSAKVTRLTALVSQREPKTRLHIQYGMSGEIADRIQEHKLHGGFFLGTSKQMGIRSIFLENIHYSLICPKAEHDAIRQGIPQSLENHIWIEMSGAASSNRHLQQFWRANRLAPKRQILCDYPQTIIDLVADGLGIAMVPESKAAAAINAGRPVAVIEEYRQTLPLHFIHADEYAQNPGLQLLKQCIGTVWQMPDNGYAGPSESETETE